MKRDKLAGAALIAALAGTMTSEWRLAVAVGFNSVIALCVPVALDVYALAAFRARRDVAAVVVALIAVNATAHLVESGLLPVSVPVVIAVSAIAPLVLWRVHALTGHSAPKDAPVPAPVTEPPTPAPAPAERPAVDAPEPTPKQPAAPAPRRTANAADDADELLPAAQALAERLGRKPPLRMLQAELRIGQRRAQRLQAALT